ncbi:hypothetical protein N4286_14170, partial [Staphylococcus aureus]|nr:hypothetical protein [Staphylococcus aureus]
MVKGQRIMTGGAFVAHLLKLIKIRLHYRLLGSNARFTGWLYLRSLRQEAQLRYFTVKFTELLNVRQIS